MQGPSPTAREAGGELSESGRYAVAARYAMVLKTPARGLCQPSGQGV